MNKGLSQYLASVPVLRQSYCFGAKADCMLPCTHFLTLHPCISCDSSITLSLACIPETSSGCPVPVK